MKFLVFALSALSVAKCQMAGQPQPVQQVPEPSARTPPQQQQKIIVVNPEKDKVSAFVIQKPQQGVGVHAGVGAGVALPPLAVGADVGVGLGGTGVGLGVGVGGHPHIHHPHGQPIKVIEEVVVKQPGHPGQVVKVEEIQTGVHVSHFRPCHFNLPLLPSNFNFKRKGHCTSIPNFFGCITRGGLIALDVDECSFGQGCCIPISV